MGERFLFFFNEHEVFLIIWSAFNAWVRESVVFFLNNSGVVLMARVSERGVF